MPTQHGRFFPAISTEYDQQRGGWEFKLHSNGEVIERSEQVYASDSEALLAARSYRRSQYGPPVSER